MRSLLSRARPRPPDLSPDAGRWGPDSLAAEPRCVQAGSGWAATLTVTGYPAEVGPGWLEPLWEDPGRVDVAVHIHPIPSEVVAGRLRRQRARLESSRRVRARRDRLDDPDVEAAATDAAELAARIARGQGRLFRVGLAITVHAPTRDQLETDLARIRALASSLLLDTHPATWRSVQGYVSTLPLGVDLLGTRRTLDTDALAASFPFTSPDLPPADPARPGQASGVFLGLNAFSAGVVIRDRFTGDNYNQITLAASGAGKSYATKLEHLHWLYQGVGEHIVDPDGEYVDLAQAVGGTVITLGAPGVHLNPLDLPAPGQVSDGLTRQVLFVHTVLGVLCGKDLDPAETAAADRAVLGAYRAAGITADPRTWGRPAPLVTDVQQALAADDTDPVAVDLARRLTPYTTGSFSGLFAGPTTTAPGDAHLTVYALHQAADEIRVLAGVLALDAIWRQVTSGVRRRRLVTLDEGWQLLSEPRCARYVYRLAKSARKRWTGLTVVTQDAEDLLASNLGASIVHNAASHLLLRQDASAIDRVAEVFGLTSGEARWLLTAPRGQGLLICGRNRVALHALASPAEEDLITTDPEVLAARTA